MKVSSLISSILISLLSVLNFVTYGQVSQAQVPLNPKAIPQFVDPMPHFAGNRIDASGGSLTIRYQPTRQVVVSTGTVLASGIVGPLNPEIGKANLWGYSVSNNGIKFYGPYWPAYTILAERGKSVIVKYENKLNYETYANVGLIADQTLHWADPLNQGMMANPPNMMNMDPYTGEIPVVPHLHGGEVASESDGGPDSWFTPNKVIQGPSWGIDGTDDSYSYLNTQEAATLCFHDHALGVTRLNVYAGLAGFYLLKGQDEEAACLPGWTGDDFVQEVAPAGKTDPFMNLPYLPEIEIVFQDRMFDTKGGLYFPNLPPNPMEHKFWTPEFIGDVITVNGKTWPYLSVAPRKYRFRLLNGSNARFYEIQLKDLVTGAIGPSIIQVGTDGGLMDKPVTIKGKLLLAPGERADVVIDFTNSPVNQKWTVVNSARAPYPKGRPPNGSTVGRLMQFVVNGNMVKNPKSTTTVASDNSQLPANLRPVSGPHVKLTDFSGKMPTGWTLRRQLTLNEVMGMGGPLEVLVNNTKWDGNGLTNPGLGETELPREGTTELWQIINLTADAHPIHLHLVQFQIVSRQPFNVNLYNKAYAAAFGGAFNPSAGPPLPYNPVSPNTIYGGNPDVTPFLQTGLRAPAPNERGWKDTHVVMPGEVTTFIVRFAPTDKAVGAPSTELVYPFNPSLGPGYVWHCHIIDHEDNEMMRPYKVLPPLALKSSNVAFAKAGNALKTNTTVAAEENLSERIDKVVLGQNYPNPFSVETELQFSLPQAAHVKLVLYNSAGISIKVLVDSNAPAGVNTVRVDASGLADGLYFYELKTGLISLVRRMVVQK